MIATVIPACDSPNCTDLNDNFTSYQQAKRSIKNTKFTFQDVCNTSTSSWVEGAEYYTCDNATGYLLLRTQRKEYIHRNVPMDVWLEFRETASFGRFYNSKIKGKYQLVI